MPPAKAKTAAAPAKKAAAPAGSKKAVPKMLKKLMVHKSTRHLLGKIKATAAKKKVAPEAVLQNKAKFVVKKIGGAKNGGSRKVERKPIKYYPTEPANKKRKSGHVPFKSHKRSLKAGLEPGRVCIVLAGKHRGKRVVFLKQLASGLLLVNGPFVVNQCPLRRMHQQFVIVTSTKVDVSGVKVPEHVNDKYFKVKKQEKRAKKAAEGDVFAKNKQTFKPDEQRKKDQKAVDAQLIDAIKKNQDKKLLFAYLGSYFQLRNRMYPHKLKF